MFATAQELHEASKAGNHPYDYRRDSYNSTPSTRGWVDNVLTYDGAVGLLEYCERQIKENGTIFHKSNRPWQLLDLSKKLDPTKTWVGFEFETGFETEQALRDVMGWVWDNTMHSVMDREGGNRYPVEITFAPDYMENYLEGKSDMHRLYAYIASKNYQLTPSQYSGTHANISVPSFRSRDNRWKMTYVRHILNSILQSGYIDRRTAFGREPYGWCYQADTGVHLEFKLFLSGENVEAFNRHVRTTHAIVQAIEYMYAEVLTGAHNDFDRRWQANSHSITNDVGKKFFSEWGYR